MLRGVDFKVVNNREQSVIFGAESFTINGEPKDYAISVIAVPGHSQGVYSIDILTYNKDYFSNQLTSFEGVLKARIDGKGNVDRFSVSYNKFEVDTTDTTTSITTPTTAKSTTTKVTTTKPITVKETRQKCIEHSYGEWQIIVPASVLKMGEKIRYCKLCEESEKELYRLNSFVDDNKFIFTPREFQELFFDNFNSLGFSKFGGAQISDKDGQVIIDIRNNAYKNVGNIGFLVNRNSWKMATLETEGNIEGVVMIISASEDFIANAIISVIMTCDPSISEYGATQIGKSVLEKETSWKGVTYDFSVAGDYYTMTAFPKY